MQLSFVLLMLAMALGVAVFTYAWIERSRRRRHEREVKRALARRYAEEARHARWSKVQSPRSQARTPWNPPVAVDGVWEPDMPVFWPTPASSSGSGCSGSPSCEPLSPSSLGGEFAGAGASGTWDDGGVASPIERADTSTPTATYTCSTSSGSDAGTADVTGSMDSTAPPSCDQESN